MNLLLPINIEALRVSNADVESVTKNSSYFSGATTAFDNLPYWTTNDGGDGIPAPQGNTVANVNFNIENSLSGSVTNGLDAGVHLHWTLPNSLVQGNQQADGSIYYPTLPNRWMVTRILQWNNKVSIKQWIIESDYIQTTEDYRGSSRTSISMPVGWISNAPNSDSGQPTYEPSRYVGQVYDLETWQPATPYTGSDYSKIHYLDDYTLPNRDPLAGGQSLGPLQAVSSSGTTFTAYYPDSMSLFGFHDTFADCAAEQSGFLNTQKFTLSYQVSGWHSKIQQDPLQVKQFSDVYTALGKDSKDSAAVIRASAIQAVYGWSYDPADGEPERCIYSAQVSGLPWDATSNNPYLMPSQADDASVRIAIGDSTSAALAALIREEWPAWASKDWNPSSDTAPELPRNIEDNLESLLNALQLGILHNLGSSTSLVQLEQALHQNSFGSIQDGFLWTIRRKRAEAVGPDALQSVPEILLPVDDNDLPGKIDALNDCQRQLNALIHVIESSRRQIYLDWYKYITAIYDPNGPSFDPNMLTSYLSDQILDLWAKLTAAFGVQTAQANSPNYLPTFYGSTENYLSFDNNTVSTACPADSLAGSIASMANTILALLKSDYPDYELQQRTAPRYWQPNEPSILITGDSLQPARRNGTLDVLLCRLNSNLIKTLQVANTNGTLSIAADKILSHLGFAVPTLSNTNTRDAQSITPLLDDLKALFADACLIDPSLASLVLAPALTSSPDASFISDLSATLTSLITNIQTDWAVCKVQQPKTYVPEKVVNQAITANSMTSTWQGQTPQGLGITHQATGSWQDPFLPLFMVWEATYTPFVLNTTNNHAKYMPDYLTKQFTLNENFIDLVFNATTPPVANTAIQGTVTINGSISVTSKAGGPLIDQIYQYTQNFPDENPDLANIQKYMQNKPLLSQALNGLNTALMMRRTGVQLKPYDPYFWNESVPQKLVSNPPHPMPYDASLTYFVGATAEPETDQMPWVDSATSYQLLRSGYLDITSVDIVDVFGQKRSIYKNTNPADVNKIVTAARLKPAPSVNHHAYLAPAITEPSRLLLRWLSANTDETETSTNPASNPVCGWIVPNHLENSLMMFDADGKMWGSVGVFGSQVDVTWQPAPGSTDKFDDIKAKMNPHFSKIISFFLQQNKSFFSDLTVAIEEAHTYILPANQGAAEAQAVFMGRPLAVVRVSLRLELLGLPGFNNTTGSLSAILSQLIGNEQTYDWTKRDSFGVLDVNFPLRLGDRNNLEDGLVAYLLEAADAETPFTTIFAPTATQTGDTGVVQPQTDTITLTLQPSLDAPQTPYASNTDQINDLRNCKRIFAQKYLTVLMDPLAQLHASMGVLPVKALTLPPEIYMDALRKIQAAFFTNPILRPYQSLEIPTPTESGFVWNWTLTMLNEADGSHSAQNEVLKKSQIGDRAYFSYTPQIAQDGWLRLVPAPPPPTPNKSGDGSSNS